MINTDVDPNARAAAIKAIENDWSGDIPGYAENLVDDILNAYFAALDQAASAQPPVEDQLRLAQIIDPEAFGLPNPYYADNSDRDEAKAKAAECASVLRNRHARMVRDLAARIEFDDGRNETGT
ncbi:MAG: hypothetical protein J0I54_17915 [Bosea sp.]|uniref:hypothetical protein n=1 Tax=unclassified Bosea (in: a-proteobacteria) TaxID=2653178 RepID=UPI000960D349|nr:MULTISPECIES: hypothetical protein [unclassified Bosea (in: a-proteobacteria)]MBN9458511.1 hypothetical protein [Bosea sp. (in: a-proteobacteria)]OJV06790.1 MAG: hypothetical protein BGO20_00040 [Bosea sp. 67-29]